MDKYDYDLMLYLTFFNLSFEVETLDKIEQKLKANKEKKSKSI